MKQGLLNTGVTVIATIGLAVFGLMIFPSILHAHLDGEALKDNGYQFEIGHFPEDSLIAGQQAQFSTRFEYENGNAVNKGKIWIRLAKGDEIYFSSSDFQMEDATVDFGFIFPEPGEYELTMRLVDSWYGSEATIKKMITVEPNPANVAGVLVAEKTERKSNFNLAVLTFIMGGLGGIILSRAVPLSNGNGKKKQSLEKKTP
jgi:hypothetical protein